MRKLFIGSWFLFFILIQPALADAGSAKSGISEFAKCSKQCLIENENCRKKQKSGCKANDDSCYEVCTIAYPDCMAKCPRPGS